MDYFKIHIVLTIDKLQIEFENEDYALIWPGVMALIDETGFL